LMVRATALRISQKFAPQIQLGLVELHIVKPSAEAPNVKQARQRQPWGVKLGRRR
jgi:hypothetical protein